MKIGEIWMVELPPANGHEQFGSRPAIIVGDPNLSVVLVVPLTTNYRYLKFPYTTLINSSSLNSLTKDSVALVFQLRVIDKKRFRKMLGKLSTSDSKSVKNTIKRILEF